MKTFGDRACAIRLSASSSCGSDVAYEIRTQSGAPNASPGTTATCATSIRYLGGAQSSKGVDANALSLNEVTINIAPRGVWQAILDITFPQKKCTHTDKDDAVSCVCVRACVCEGCQSTPCQTHRHSVSGSGTSPKPSA